MLTRDATNFTLYALRTSVLILYSNICNSFSIFYLLSGDLVGFKLIYNFFFWWKNTNAIINFIIKNLQIDVKNGMIGDTLIR